MATSMNSSSSETSQEESSSVFSDMNEFSQKTLRAVLMATKSSNDLPVGDDFDFYSTFRSVRDVLDFEGRRILTLLQRLLRHQNVKGGLHLEHPAELEDQFDLLMDANDQILERAGALLDEASGLRKEETKLVIVSASTPQTKTSWNKPAASTKKPEVAYRLMTAKNIQRPQLRFREKIDNSNLPFKPRLHHKPHALRSLEESLKLPDGVILEETEKPDFIYPHPYQTELQSFVPCPELQQKVTPKEALPINLTPLLHVNTTKELLAMIDDLKKQKEIAVDLEHHSYRSFQGVTCLMQISTRSSDYIIDVLELRSEMHHLIEVFADPSITKVFHGADSDIGWLQRDMSLYVVNMFDTGQAARVLGLSRFSLAHLMLNYCKMEVDKQYQLADWRIRPLPAELITYAREDTHYLLYIYDMMRNQLIERGNEQSNLLLSVYDRSQKIAAKVYQKPTFKDGDYLELYLKSKKVFNNQQLTALRDLYSWRDSTARIEDESLGYVLPTHMLLQIAEILPRERQGVLACCNPIPPLVRQNLIEIHDHVLRAREVPLTKVEKAPVLQPSVLQHPKYDAESLLNCPHDQTHADERIGQAEQNVLATAPGLAAGNASMFAPAAPSSLVKRSPVITAFAAPSTQNMSKALVQKIVESIKSSFKSHFVKFLPSETGQAVIKPQSSEMWVLKPPTVLKRKTDNSDEKVDLNSFKPEFVQPSKKSRTDAGSLFKVPGQRSSKSSSLFRIPAEDGSQKNEEPAQKGITGESIEKQIKSLRQQMVTKKKKDKIKKKKRDKSRSQITDANMDISNTLPVVTVHDISNNNSTVPSSITTSMLSSSQEQSSIDQSSSSSSLDISVSKIKKKKKKKKLSLADVEDNFQPFDYASAEKQLFKKNKDKPKMDVFNPSLPSRSGKHKVRRPRLAGPKSNTALSFTTPGKSPGGKHRKL